MSGSTEEEEEEASSFERAVAELELLAAAFPEEVELPVNNDDDDYDFPFVLTLRLLVPRPHHSTLAFSTSEKISGSGIVSGSGSGSSIDLEIARGYPIKAGIRVVSWRSSKFKEYVERAVESAREEADICLENGEEAALAVCAAALETWNRCWEEKLPAEEETTTPKPNPRAVGHHQYRWFTSSVLTDRKSHFQSHVTVVKREDQVAEALRFLIEGNSKLQRATHNMYAYRIKLPAKEKEGSSGSQRSIIVHDNNDDGEDGAGSRLAHLLERREESGVLVVVSRWFGGIHLGPKRFAHIVNVARELLERLHNSGELATLTHPP